jgi:hypothetical protein
MHYGTYRRARTSEILSVDEKLQDALGDDFCIVAVLH